MSNPVTSRPIAALAWKEWREQRPLVMAGLALSATLPLILLAGMGASGREWDLGSLVLALPVVNAVLVWPLLAVTAGSTTISNEIAEGTLAFILSRPVPRRTIWLMKVIFGCLTVLAVALGSLVVFWSCRFLIAGATGELSFESAIHLVFDVNPTIELVVACLFFIFAAGVFFSTFITRALTAAAGAILLSLTILPVLFLVWTRMDMSWMFEAGFLGFQICLGGVLTLCSSLYLFTRDEGQRRLGRSLATGIGMVSGGLMLVGIPIIYVHTRVTPETAYLQSATLSPVGDRVVVEVTGENSLVEQLWSVPLTGSGHTRLTGRYARIQSFSPDGRWIAYLSQRGFLGLRSDVHSLRIASVDGNEDHLVAANVTIDDDYFRPLLVEFSPDSSKLAYTVEQVLYIASIESTLPVAMAIPEGGCEAASVIGWTPGGREVLLFGRPTCLSALDPVSGRIRMIGQRDEDSRVLWSTPAGGYRHVPLLVTDYENETITLSLFDVQSGERTVLSETACNGGEFSPDGSSIGYAVCVKEGGSYRSEFRLREIDSGSERSLGMLEGQAFGISLSPAGTVAAARVRGMNDEDAMTFIITEERSLRILGEWIPLGWADPGRLALMKARWDSGLAVATAQDGGIEELFP